MWFLSIALGILYCEYKSRNQASKRTHSENTVLLFNKWTMQTGTMLLSSWTSGVTSIFHCIIFCTNLPLQLGEIKKIVEGKKKKKEDIAKNVHKARYLMMKIITLKTTTWGTFWVIIITNIYINNFQKLHIKFSTRSRLCTF